MVLVNLNKYTEVICRNKYTYALLMGIYVDRFILKSLNASTCLYPQVYTKLV